MSRWRHRPVCPPIQLTPMRTYRTDVPRCQETASTGGSRRAAMRRGRGTGPDGSRPYGAGKPADAAIFAVPKGATDWKQVPPERPRTGAHGRRSRWRFGRERRSLPDRLKRAWAFRSAARFSVARAARGGRGCPPGPRRGRSGPPGSGRCRPHRRPRSGDRWVHVPAIRPGASRSR